MRDVVFLFGAGADSVYQLCTGEAFAECLLKNQYQSEKKQLLGEDIANCALIHPNSRKVYLQTIESNQTAANKVFGEDEVKRYIRYYNSREKSKADKEWVAQQCKTWYEALTGKRDVDTSDTASAVEFFLKNTVFFDAIDEKFNALRKMPLNSSAKVVINTYTTIFIKMVKSLYRIPNDFEWTYRNVTDLLCKPYDKITDLDKPSYYSRLKKTRLNCAIFTTNYTDICEKVSGKRVYYLHGNLKWFEDYKRLTVYDCSVEKEKDEINSSETVFPFIMIPSGVKPIICKKELEMFFEFSKALANAKELCVLGYRFNREDNHINALIADWLRNDGNNMTYFNFNGDCDLSVLEWISDDMRNRIKVIETNGNNALNKFDNYLAKRFSG